MKCEVCNETDLEGELAAFASPAFSETLDEEVGLIMLRGTARRNHIICDSCNKAVCHNCCSHAKSGYCDRCIDKYGLQDIVRGIEEDA
jgi:hypothetical protein